MNCPHCNQEISRSDIAKALRKLNPNGRGKVIRPCKMCGKHFSARDMRKHSAQCPMNPKRFALVPPAEEA